MTTTTHESDLGQTPGATPAGIRAPTTPSFAEEALRLGGKSVEEARRTGAMDAADDQVEDLFALSYRTAASPLHRAVWDRSVPAELFSSVEPTISAEAAEVTKASLKLVERHLEAGTLYDERQKVSERVLRDLAGAGYWGLLVRKKYGGSGASFSQFARCLTEMATLDPTVAGLASVHGCIGAVDPVQTFGNAEQKRRFLPKLAGGERLSGFALTEPCAGTDLTALRTTATLRGDHFVVDGEKLFITNARPGRTIGLVCLVEDRPAVLIVDLPDAENEHFRLKAYGLYALRHTHNHGIVLRGLRVPAANLLRPADGDGLTIAYHGLNRGRVSLAAGAAGTMRLMLADTIPWVRFRRTYGAAIGSRELVRRRIGYLAGLIVACDALTEWCAGLLDQGYRGEMECTVAKIFASEAQKEAAIELYMKTHGGRAFLSGHMFGDNVHEFLAPCIYEGEGEMLSLALFKSLVKHHARKYFEPIAKTLSAAGTRKPNLLNPVQLWAVRGPLWSYAKWLVGRSVAPRRRLRLPPMPPNLTAHAQFASDRLHRASLELSAAMRKHQLKLADRQCRMADLSGRVQTAAVILATSLFAARRDDELIRQVADCICQELTRRLTGQRPTDRYFRLLTETGTAVIDGQFAPIDGIVSRGIQMPYPN